MTVHEVSALTDRLTTISLNFNAKLREQRHKLLRDIETNRKGHIPVGDIHTLAANTRHHEYKFAGMRQQNKDDYIAFLDAFLSFAGSEFHCLLVERNAEAQRHCSGAKWPVYIRVTSTLLKHRPRSPVFLCCDWQTRPKNQPLRLEDEMCRLEHVAGCVRMASEMSCFLQVTDLLLGVVSFDWRDARGQIAPSGNVRAKREI